MPRLQLSKSSLSRETANLKTYTQFLPSLDLKRQELMAQKARAREALARTRREIEVLKKSMSGDLPMLSNRGVELDGLVEIERVRRAQENVMGARLPVLQGVDFRIREYSYLSKPEWVDGVVAMLRQGLELEIRLRVEQQRFDLLVVAVQKITQRVNLFDKVLIPGTRRNIQRIQIYLSDAERAGVVNAKLAKNKRARETAS